MATNIGSLQYQIEKKLITIVGWSLFLMATTVMVIAVASVYIYRVNKIEYFQDLITTKISAEVSGAMREAHSLAGSSLLWTGLTDSSGREVYLDPLFSKINQNENHNIELLDYRGRPVISTPGFDLNNQTLKDLITNTVKSGQPQYVVDHREGFNDTLLATVVVNAPIADTPLGFLLVSVDLTALVASVNLPPDVSVYLSGSHAPRVLDRARVWQQRMQTDFVVPSATHPLSLHLIIQQSALYAVATILLGFIFSLAMGWWLLRQLKSWSLGFARTTTSRLSSLLESARDIVSGKDIALKQDQHQDEISSLFQSLRQILSTQQELNQRLLTLSRIFDNAAEAIMVTDIQGRIINVNPALLRLTGYQYADLMGKKSGLLYRDQTNEAVSEEIVRAIEQHGEWRGETYFIDARSQPIPVMLSASKLRSETGENLGYVSLFSDISPIKQAESRLRELSYNDQLTGLPNYRSFVEHVTELCANPEENFSCVLIFIDLDNLKMINDQYGHEEGDLAIIQLSKHLREYLPPGSFICRRSGDEFIALIEDTQNLPFLVRDLRKMSHRFSVDMGISQSRLIQTSFSAGAAKYPQDAHDLNSFLVAADMALRIAKESGRAQLVWYNEVIQARVQRHNVIHEKLAHALKHSLIVPHYQPCVELKTGRIVGFEALARWTDPELGIMSAEEFVGIAEQTSLISPLTTLILERVLKDRSAIRNAFPGASISVNVSPQFFAKRQATRFFSKHIDQDQDGIEGIVLELTETEISRNTQSIQFQLQTLIGMGLTLAIDDFGKGYSSLARLGALPFQKIKIDRSFVSNIEDGTNMKIVKAIIALGSSLGMEIIAEGVETEAQRDILIKNGCELAQGFLFSEAIPLEQLLALPGTLSTRD
ncbi:EAL domain-containing protein [Zwartia sp.]|uniref:putative bifunctional diguanylate cyclase/phosphodiesterase n=1 Tax=Zwartia sp. TaxID=2978004 RepID=UPI00271B4D1E|nr:EAL domain-containing protein [Zwartia sp.]MDO9023223.1 EAL domain-containing protein [Zwartia sp.]